MLSDTPYENLIKSAIYHNDRPGNKTDDPWPSLFKGMNGKSKPKIE